jgi:hypothetical protein
VHPHLRVHSKCVPYLRLLSDRHLPVGSQVVNVHWCILVHVTLVALSSHSIPKCQEKQTPEPCPFLGPGQSGVIHRIWALCNFCSVPPCSITLFYTKRLCQVSWPPWWSDPLTHLYSPFLRAGHAWNVGYAYCCGHPRSIVNCIALKSKVLCIALSMIG